MERIIKVKFVMNKLDNNKWIQPKKIYMKEFI